MPEPTGIAATAEDFHGQPCLRLVFGPQDNVLVALHGAHVLSWLGAGEERLFLSPKALLDGKSAIRGGVPVCFPQFNDRGPLPKHGFARNLRWMAGGTGRDAATSDVQLSLRLASDATTLAIWPQQFEAELTVSIGPGRLKIELAARNTGTAAWSFSCALHTYLRVHALAGVRLEGLSGQPYWDGPSDTRGTQSGDIAFTGEFDRVYRAAPQPLVLRDGSRALRIAQSTTFADTVVWNPGAAKCATLADMPADGFEHMACVEAAQVEQPIVLTPGAQWVAWQRLSVD